MPSLQIRDLNPKLYAMLKRRAVAEHRSLAQQATALIEAALAEVSDGRQRRQEILAAVQANRVAPLPKKAPTPEDFIAEDRHR